jgi:hypothetical protein
MPKNVGTVDMIIRLIAGAALLYIGLIDNPIVSSGMSKTIVGIMGLVPIATALLRYCPLYFLAGIDTCGSGVTVKNTP